MATVRARIGIRELRDTLTATIRRVRNGETLEVTHDGVPVAVLAPVRGDRVEQLLAGGDVDDATFAALAKHFTPQEIIEISVTATNYYGTGLLTRALRIEIETDGRHTAHSL